MNIGSILGINGTLTNWAMGIHSHVANVYNELIGFAGATGNETVDGLITDFRNNLYILIGIFMVFRLGISLINYLINPDAIGDKQAGAGKMITRIVTSFILLLAMPWIFDKLTELETVILANDGALDKLIHLVSIDKENITTNEVKTSFLIDDVEAAKKQSGKACPYEKLTLNGYKFNVETLYGCYYEEDKFRQIAIDAYKDYFPNVALENIQECTNVRTSTCYEINKFDVVSTSNASKYSEGNVIQRITTSGIESVEDSSYADRDKRENVLTINLEITKEANSELTCYYVYNSESSEEHIDQDTGLTQGNNCCGSKMVTIKFNKQGAGKPIKVVNWFGLAEGKETGWYAQVQTEKVAEFNPTQVIFDYAYIHWGYGEQDFKTMLDNGECPQGITDIKCSGEGCSATANNNSTVTIRKNSGINDKNRLTNGTTNIQEIRDNIENCTQNGGFLCDVGENGEIVDNTTVDPDKQPDYEQQTGQKLYPCAGDNAAGCNFSRQLMEAFVTYDGNQQVAVNQRNQLLSNLRKQYSNEEITKEEYEKQIEELRTDATNISPRLFDRWPEKSEEISDSVEKGEHDFNFLLSLILGIGVLVFLLAMGIEIVIRSFKLMILQMLAPVPIIMYMNPNDKMFDGWLKQYAGTYLDLFIKLLGIKLVSILLASAVPALIAESGSGLLVTIAYIMAAVLFMKIAPDFISKILGVKDMGGSMKDTFGMMKKGLTATTGAAVGLAGGAIAGYGAYHASKGQSGWNRAAAAFSALGTGLSSTLRGAGAGAKGNITGGWQHASKTNAKRQALYEAGYGAGNVMLSSMAMGLYDPNKKDEIIEKAYDDILSKQKTMDSRIEDELLKKNYYRDKERRDELATMRSTGKDLSGNTVTAADIAAYEKNYVDTLAANKARYMRDIQDPTSGITDAQTLTNMKVYDRTIEQYKGQLGKKAGTAKDADYTYDFTNLQTTEQVVADVNAGKSAADLKDSYKATKSRAEDQKVVFSGSATRANHINVPKEK